MENIFFDPKNTIIGKAVSFNRTRKKLFFRFITLIVWLLGIVSIAVIIDSYFFRYLAIDFSGWPYIFLSIFLFYLADRAFYFDKLSDPRPAKPDQTLSDIKSGQRVNLFEVLSLESAEAFLRLDKGVDSTNSELFISLISSREMNFILLRLGLSAQALENYVAASNSSGKIKTIFTNALSVAKAENHHQIEIGDIFIALCENDPAFSKMLRDLGITLEDIGNLVYWQTFLTNEREKEKGLLNPAHLRLTGGVGKDWAFGWTLFLKRFSVDITRQIEASGLNLEIIGHDKEIGEIKEALMRENGGNAIVVGEPGVGKRTTVLGFASRVLEGKTESQLDFQHIVQVDTDYLMAGLQNFGEVAERLTGVLNEVAAAGNIIMFIENIQNLLSSGEPGQINSSEILMPFLDNPAIHVIATCDVANFNQFISPNTSLMQRLTRVNVEEPNQKEMVRILEDVLPSIEAKSRVIISYEAIKEVLKVADKYIQNLPNPEKSINLLDSIATHAAAERGKTIILPKDVDDYITQKYQVPAGEADQTEKEKLINLEQLLHASVIGQNEAISAIANALRRARAGITDSKKPIGSFLFLGPTGVGKTETAKALARAYFGAEDKMIRFDMSEFQNKEDIYRLIGASVTNEPIQGVLTTAIREHPFSLVLFDEVEKAHSDILNLFLQLLDEGFVTDGFGRKTSFSNSIIIATSNAGANLIREAVKSGQDYEKTKKALLDYVQNENIYRPEFLNRFNGIIAFSPLTPEEIIKVGALQIEKLKKTILANKGVEISLQPGLIIKLAQIGYDPQMGARPMARIIQDKVENFLAKEILSGQINKGDSLMITEKDIL